MRQQVPMYRPPSRGVGSYEEWQDDALCREHPSELFELGGSDKIERGEQEELIAEGLAICAGCPVRQPCKVNSSELDRYWTTRGGQPPEGLFPDSVKPVDPGISKRFQEKCKCGHKDWALDSRGHRRCLTCRREQNRKYIKARRDGSLDTA